MNSKLTYERLVRESDRKYAKWLSQNSENARVLTYLYRAREPYNWAILARGRIMKNCRPILKLFAKKVDETPLK